VLEIGFVCVKESRNQEERGFGSKISIN